MTPLAWVDDGSGPRIRRYLPRDCQLLVEAIDAVCGECGWMATSRFEPTADWLRALNGAETGERCLLVVEENGKVAGWCRVFPQGDGPLARQASLGIGLLAPYRQRGIGTALVRRAVAWARAAGYVSIKLTTHARNAPALYLFDRCGFVLSQPVLDGSIEMSLSLESPGAY